MSRERVNSFGENAVMGGEKAKLVFANIRFYDKDLKDIGSVEAKKKGVTLKDYFMNRNNSKIVFSFVDGTSMEILFDELPFYYSSLGIGHIVKDNIDLSYKYALSDGERAKLVYAGIRFYHRNLLDLGFVEGQKRNITLKDYSISRDASMVILNFRDNTSMKIPFNKLPWYYSMYGIGYLIKDMKENKEKSIILEFNYPPNLKKKYTMTELRKIGDIIAKKYNESCLNFKVDNEDKFIYYLIGNLTENYTYSLEFVELLHNEEFKKLGKVVK